MTGKDLFKHFMEKGTWVDSEKTVDQFAAGNPEKEIKKVAVTWMSDMASIEWSIENDIDLLLTHEPTYYNHFKDLEKYSGWNKLRPKKIAGMEKEKLLNDSGLIIMRNHDVWDLFPEIGIPYAWAKFLGILSKPVEIGNDGYQHRYDIKPVNLEVFAKRIAAATQKFNQQGVKFFGDKEQTVSKIGIGTGCGCSIEAFIEMDCDVSVICDDGQLYWMDISFAKDIGHPVVQVNHAVSEEAGMITMCNYINETFEELDAVYLPHQYGATYVNT